MQILRPYPRPPDSETLEYEAPKPACLLAFQVILTLSKAGEPLMVTHSLLGSAFHPNRVLLALPEGPEEGPAFNSTNLSL